MLLHLHLEVWLLLQVASHMLVQVALLCESQITPQLVFERTYERSFFRVDSQVIIKVVPLSEVHRAIRVVALQDLQVSLGLWVLELEDSE